MSLHSNPPFPLVPSLRTILSVKKSPTSGMPARGVEGLRPGVVTFDKTIVERTPTDEWQPIAAIGAYDLMPASDPGGEPVMIDGLSRVSWWLMNLTYVGDPVNPLPAPPQIDFSFRASFIGISEAFTDSVVTTSFTSYRDTGLLMQISGILCTQFEVWAAIPVSEGPVGTKIKIRLGGSADRLGGGPLTITPGSLTG